MPRQQAANSTINWIPRKKNCTLSSMAFRRALISTALKRSKSDLHLHRRWLSGGAVSAPPVLPAFDYQPKPYTGPLADEVLQKRKKFLGSSLFYYYQKPVSTFLFRYLCFDFLFVFGLLGLWLYSILKGWFLAIKALIFGVIVIWDVKLSFLICW